MKKFLKLDFTKYKNIYVISDIHGHLNEFNKMLDLINFNNNEDLLIVNGDTIDRGYANIEVLNKCLFSKNIHFILGNHESMMLDGLLRADDDMFSNWFLNGGEKTYEEYLKLEDTLKSKILIELSKKPLAITGNINGIDHIIVHAGIDYIGGLTSLNEIENMMNYQGDNLLWTRDKFLKAKNSFGGKIIFGHTPTPIIRKDLREFTENDIGKSLKELALIWKKDNKIGIDCGVAFGGNLACLRLNDMKEFYI